MKRTGSTTRQRTRVVAYLRVSTYLQAERGVSLDAQAERVRAYAELYDLELVEIVRDEGLSASTLERPGLQRCLAMLRAGKVDALLVAKLDRLTRNVRDLCDLVERFFASGKLALMSVGEQFDTRSAAGRLVMNVLASVSQWERGATGARTSVAMRHKASRLEYTGGRPPYGWRVAPDEVHLEPVAEEAVVIEAVRTRRAAGGSLRDIAAELERRGVRTRNGTLFAPTQIARMLGQEAA